MRGRLSRRAAGLGMAGLASIGLVGGSVAAQADTAPAHQAAMSAVSTEAGREHDEKAARPMPMPAVALDYAQTLWQLRDDTLETTFLGGMIGHHQGAVEMAELAVERADDPRLVTMAENIVASQLHEVDQMTTWLDEWYGLTPEQAVARAPKPASAQIRQMDEHMQGMLAELRRVPGGKKFDRAFLQRMTPHHQMAIVESQPAQSFAVHPQLRLTANNIISGQAAEVAQMLDWLEAW